MVEKCTLPGGDERRRDDPRRHQGAHELCAEQSRIHDGDGAEAPTIYHCGFQWTFGVVHETKSTDYCGEVSSLQNRKDTRQPA